MSRIICDYPQNYFISSGVGVAEYKLISFDNALIDAGISNYNLLRVSSILPIGCTKAEKVDVKYGSPLLVAYGEISSNQIGERVSSAISIAIPDNNTDIGIIMEYAGVCEEKEALDIVQEMAERAMKNHGISTKEIVLSSQSAIVTNGYTTVISAVSLW